MSDLSDLRETRLDKAKELKRLGQGPYALNFQPTHQAAELQKENVDLPKGEERLVDVSIAGRVISRRVMGKLAFFTLADETGQIQLYLEKATLNSESSEQNNQGAFAQLTDLVDTGDWIGVNGILRRTDRGELSVKVHTWKCFQNLFNHCLISGMD